MGDTPFFRMPRRLDNRFWMATTLAIWTVTLIVMGTLVVRDPIGHSVTTNYRVAAAAFWNEQPMYHEGQHGWLYPPQGAIVYSLFSSWPSLAAGEVAWRVAITAVFVYGLYRLAQVGLRGTGLTGFGFALLSLASLALAAGCMRNGQMNLPLAGMFMLACCALAERKWWEATLWLSVALAAKPIALPLVLLAGALYPPMWWRMGLGVIAVIALPYINWNWAYVTGEYAAALSKMKEAGSAGAGIFSEFTGMMKVFPMLGPGKASDWQIDERVLLVIRGGMALVTLVLAWLGLRKFGIVLGSLVLLLLANGYLMVFNPRTEGNSYVIFVPLVGLLFAWALLTEYRPLRALVWLVMLILYAAAHELYKEKLDSVWVRPALTLGVYGWVAWMIVRTKPADELCFGPLRETAGGTPAPR